MRFMVIAAERAATIATTIHNTCRSVGQPCRVARAASVIGFVPPRTPEEALNIALADADIKVAALAAMYAVETGDARLVASVGKAQEKRRDLEPATRDVFQDSLTIGRPAVQYS